MLFSTRVSGLLLVTTITAATLNGIAAFATSSTAAQAAAPVKAVGSVELTDPVGDVEPIIYRQSVGSGPEREVKYPPFDVIKLAISSDGKALTFAATLSAPPGRAAYEVVEFYVDTDNNAKTGITHPDHPRLVGMEYYGTLEACLEHEFFGTRCATTEEKPRHTAVVTLEKFGKEWMFKDALLDIPAAGKVREPKKTPVSGALVQSTLDYVAMGVKSGQTIRLVAREYGTGKVKNVAQGFFPEIVLTLK